MSTGASDDEETVHWYEARHATDLVTDDVDPATARVLGGELTDDYDLTYGYLDDLFEPTADRINLRTHGERFQHSTVMDDEVMADLNRSLNAMGTFPDPYDTPADLLAEYVARKYTLGRQVYDRVERLSEEFSECRDTLNRLIKQDIVQEKKAVMIPFGDHLLQLGAFLHGRYETPSPSDPDTELPAFPNPGQARLVVETLTAYDEVLPDTETAAERLRPIPGPLETIGEARLGLSVAAVAVAYARWDASVEGSWPLDVAQYDVTFDRPSPETDMETLAEYTTEGIRIDSRAFDRRLKEAEQSYERGEFLDHFRSLAGRYVQMAKKLL
ncbi:hypothetical protein RYH80_17705 [Halobaculum sp. MBLA0147]|uniref:hypothetical protein n=1 Tax=Halobaculum sp. MBLA0147 TaxID=3079934 RepID=UPI0035269FC5